MKDVDGLVCQLSHEKELLLARVKELEVTLEDEKPYKELLRNIDNLFGCEHVDKGPDDAQEVVRHVKELQAQLHQRDTALMVAREALEWKINGFTLREYLKVQFPATIGHYPIEGHLDRLDHALFQIQAVKP